MRMRRAVKLALLALACVTAAGAAQVSFEQATRDLASPDPNMRLRAVQLLKDAAYPEAAEPIARLLADPDDGVQLEAIAAELNIFLADKVVSRRRVGFLVEVRTPIVAETAFSSGPLALGSAPVPLEVLTALRAAARDDNPRVGVEALYAFGVLALEPGGNRRRQLLAASGPDVAAIIGAVDAPRRFAAVRVIGRLFEPRPQDDPVNESVGDAAIVALNDSVRAIRGAAMYTLGLMRYERGLQALTELFQHYGRGDLAAGALDGIARIAHRSSSPLLVSQLTTRNAVMKTIAIEGLARVGDAARLADIEAALAGERNDSVLLARDFASARLSNASIDPIVQMLTRPRLRDQALQYFVELAPGRSSAFSQHIQDPDARIRRDGVDALGLSYDPAALPIVERAMKDSDPQVARAAERAVARLKGVVPLFRRGSF